MALSMPSLLIPLTKIAIMSTIKASMRNGEKTTAKIAPANQRPIRDTENARRGRNLTRNTRGVRAKSST